MGDWVRIVGWSIVSALKSQRDLTLENVALRHPDGAPTSSREATAQGP